MGIRFTCPNGHKLHVKAELAGKRGVCPQCGARTMIPFEGQGEQTPPLDPVAGQSVGPLTSSSSVVGTAPASPSILIDVSDSVATTPAAAIPPPMPPIVTTPSPVAVNPPVQVVAPPPAEAAQPFVFPEAPEPVSPAARYVARRERNRRNQVTFAVMLLLAVVVLAGVLIFVLKRGGGVAPVSSSQSVGLNERPASRYTAVGDDFSFNAHGALAANE